MAEDHFADLDLASLGMGALAGAGAEDHYASRTSYRPDAVKFEIVCDPCGQRQEVLVSWDELIFVSLGVPPPGNPQSPPWVYSARYGALHPNVRCCKCGLAETLVMLTPDEAERHLRAGMHAQYIAPGYVSNAKDVVRRMGAGYRQ